MRVQHQVRGAAHGLGHVAVKAPEAEVKIPGQKALRTLHHALRDHKARCIQRHKHVLEHAGDGGNALHVLERVFEAGVGGIELPDLRQVLGPQVLKKRHDGRDGLVGVQGDGSGHGAKPFTVR